MKKLIVIFLTTLLIAPAVGSSDGGVVVMDDNMSSLSVSFVTGELSFEEAILGMEHFYVPTIKGYLPSNRVGLPSLPIFSQLIEVPLCSGFDVQVSNVVYDTVDAPSLWLMPVQPPIRKSDRSVHAMVMDKEAYSTDSFYHEPMAQVEPIGIARDRNLARLQFSPVSYNPVSRKVIICRSATVTVVYRDADPAATKAMFERYYTPAFSPAAGVLNSLYPKSVSSSAPIRYLIVAHSMFRNQLDTFVQWKRRKGFLVDVAYTDSAAVGNTSTSIAAFIQSQYINASSAAPAPTYLLLVGDVAQIPPFTGVTDNSHVTDLYYTTWTTGDNVPDCYHGRFSAQNIAQLTPQIEKTLMYEQYTFADPSFLDRAVMVSGVDAGNVGDNAYTYGDPSMDYAITNYINGGRGFQQVRYFKNNTSIVPSASNVVMGNNTSANSAFVRSCYNEGAGLINYTAHGSPTSWGTPYLGTDNVPEMTNYQKFGLMIGNCCQSNTFTLDACLGEALLRRGDYCGAVGYIGASNSTYWTYDFYWTVGSRSSVGPTMSLAYDASKLGAYDRLCHTHNEAFSQWSMTQAAMMMAGNLAVAAKVGNNVNYYWEIYHLMGDPSVMPYLTQAQTINLVFQPIIVSSVVTLQVSAVPYAYVAMTDSATHTLVASAFANASGVATLAMPSSLVAGSYEVTASAQQYRTAFRDLKVIAPVGNTPYAFVSKITDVTPVEAGSDAQFTVELKNLGSAGASNVVVHWSSDSPLVTFVCDSIALASIGSSQIVTLTSGLTARLSQQIVDGAIVNITATTTWGSNSSTVTFPIYVTAPKLEADYSATSLTVLPGATASVSVTMTNKGHAALPTSILRLASPTSLCTASAVDTTPFSIMPGNSVTRQFSLHADNQLPQGIMVPLRAMLDGFYSQIDDTVQVYTMTLPTETFEGASFHLSGWTQGSQAWEFTSAVADGGTWSLRSNSTLSHSQTSEVTLQGTVTQADSIRFRYKVSSEANYDKFHFYIDNVEVLTASGLVGWTSAAYYVQPGSHSFRFTYSKDYSVSDSLDCAWIDNVVLPPSTTAVTFLTDTVCMGGLYVVAGDTINTNTPITGTHVVNSPNEVTVLDYTVLPPAHIDTVMTVCDSLWYGDNVYTESGDTTFTVSVANGCDSIVTLHLTVNHSVYDTMSVAERGENYQWDNDTYTTSGIYTHYYTTSAGCDSSVTLMLTLVPSGEGIDTALVDVVRLYPSPTSGVVHFSSQVIEATVYDLNGRLLLRQQRTSTIDLTALPAGHYTVRLTMPAGTAVGRVIKQ